MTDLATALARACAFAIPHGADLRLGPADFAIQRSDSGITHAIHLGEHHAISVTLDRDGRTSIRIAQLDWVHQLPTAETIPTPQLQHS